MARQFSDTTNKNGVIQRIEYMLGKADGSISGNATLLKQVTASVNFWYNRAVTIILESIDDWDIDDATITATRPIAQRALAAARRDYAFSTVSSSWQLLGKEGAALGSSAAIVPLQIRRVDITYDGTNWYRAEPLDKGSIGLGMGNDTTVDGRFSKSKPFYDLEANSILIFPAANSTDVANGAKMQLHLQRLMTAFASGDTTKTVGFEEPFDELVIIGPSYEYAIANDLKMKVGTLGVLLADTEAKCRTYFGRKNADRNVVMTPAFVDYG